MRKQRVSKADEEEKMVQMAAAGLRHGTRHGEEKESNAARGAAPGIEGVKPTPRSPLAEALSGAQSAKAPPQASAPVVPSADTARPRSVFQVLEESRVELEAMSRSMLELGRAGLRLVQLSFELTLLTTRSILLARW